MEKVTHIWKFKLSQPWTFDNDSDFVQFLTSTFVWIQKYSPMFDFHWKNPSVISQWYIKNECSDMAWFGLSLFQLHNVCLEYSGCASHFLVYARLVTFKSAKKWYILRMSISWLCPFKRLLLLLMSFYWILANAFQIWSKLDGYEKLAGKFEAISNELKHGHAKLLVVTITSNLYWNVQVSEMVKKASKRLCFLGAIKACLCREGWST